MGTRGPRLPGSPRWAARVARTRMTGPLYRIGRVCSRHHWPVIVAWILAAVALVVVSAAAGEQNSDNLSLPGSGSNQGHGPAPVEAPEQAYGTNPIVLQAPSGKLTDSKYKKPIDDTVVLAQEDPPRDQGGEPARRATARAALSKDKTIGYISVTLDEGPTRPQQGGGAGRSSTRPTRPRSRPQDGRGRLSWATRCRRPRTG